MSVIGLTFVFLNAKFGTKTLHSYEHYADYALGLLLLFFGAYFLTHAGEYFDIEWKPKRATCSCHGLGHDHAHGHHAADAEDVECSKERTPLQGKSGKSHVARHTGS